MEGALILFLVPVGLYVLAFLYETYLSFERLFRHNSAGRGYVAATWEITHTLLVFAVVMLLMMYSQVIDALSATIFSAAFLALAALTIRACVYLYVFFVKKITRIGVPDVIFALSHVVAAGLLLLTVYQAVNFIVTIHPPANSQFLPYFIPGLLLVVAVTVLPIVWLYIVEQNHEQEFEPPEDD